MDNETEWTLKRLVAQLDLPTTTVDRQLSTLTDRGYLVQDPVRKSYRVGPRLLLLSSTVLSHSDLRSTARPELEKLSATVKETINLSVMLDREIHLFIDEQGAARDAASFSAGTVDGVMLCMRLALVDALFQKEQPFLLLDDPFVNLDDEATCRALSMLRELAKQRQVVYLTCNTARI